MHIKFLPHSKGSGRAAANYLLGDLDHQGRERAGVQVLRGDPNMLGQLIDSLDSVHRYTSGVIAFHVDDDPTDAEIQHALDEFERVAFAGLEKNQYAYCAVLHEEEDGSKHIHFVIPRVELTSGKSMNIAPPGWKKIFDPLRDALNFEHGWARPADPRLQRLVQPGRAAQWADWKNGEDPRQQITSWLVSQVAAGIVNSRVDVIHALETLGVINRQGKDYISIRINEGAKPIRLKGPIYAEKFDGESFREAATAAQRRPRGREKPDFDAAAIARARLEHFVAKRSEYNEERFPAPAIADRAIEQFDVEKIEVVYDLADYRQPEPVASLNGDRGGVELVDGQSGNQSVGKNSIRPEDEIEAAKRPVLQQSSGQKSLQTSIAKNNPTSGANNDRDRTAFDAAIETAQRSARAAIEAVERCTAAASAAAAAALRACRAVDSAASRVRANMDDELSRFKSEISLVDLAQAEYGYELVKRESSVSSKVLKCGGDKVIVTRQQGHDVYFSTGDSADNGSVIDFMQKRSGLNLGQIRKALRAWLPGSKKPALKRPARAPEHAKEVTKDRAGVLARWAILKPYAGSYLTDERGIDPEIIEAFGVRHDDRGNACFGHRDSTGVSGWELKNNGFTGFSEGGNKSLFLARPDDAPVTQIVVAEAVIDLMSWAQLKHERGTVYTSTGGSLSPDQLEQLRAVFARNSGAEIVLAHDADAPGDRMADQVRQLAQAGVTVMRDRPPVGKDWNDMLLHAQVAVAEKMQNKAR